MDTFAVNQNYVNLNNLRVQPSRNAHETGNMSGYIPCALHEQKKHVWVIIGISQIRWDHMEIGRNIRINDVCFNYMYT